jgi:hypothetical protein
MANADALLSRDAPAADIAGIASEFVEQRVLKIPLSSTFQQTSPIVPIICFIEG